jgi:M6 family metalloprotease-like protein
MKKVLTLIAVGLLCFSILPILSPQVKASLGTAPEVICIPFHGERLAVPHDAWIGKEIILKGTAHDKDGDGTMVAYKWDFGDGYATDWISGVNPYMIEAKHTYTGTMADGTPYGPGKYFTAWLYVKDNEDLVGKDSYFIAIRDKTLDVEVNVGLDNGLWWLHKQQIRATYGDGTEYGYWQSSYGYHVAFTAASTEAFELQGHLPSGNRGENPYVETVQRGLNYLFNQFHTHSISQHATYCPLGNPDVNGNGIGLACFTGEITRQIYESGIALMTISSSGAPNRIAATGIADVVGRAYKDIVQDMVDFMAWAQSDPYTGVYEGGWRYYANYGQSDNSVSQWPVIGMEAAERNFGTSGVTVPGFVRPELLKWLTYSQGGDGGFGYQGPWSWENTAKTGAGCAMLNWAGVPTTDTKFQNGLSFLNAHWYDTASSYTNFGDYYTMYAIMKGMRIPHPNVELIGTHDWYGEYARYIVDQQNAYGGEYLIDLSWLSGYTEKILATAWAMAVLIPTLVMPGPVAEAGPNVDNFPPTIPVKFDASGSYHRDPTKSIVLYEWDFESDGTWDYSGTDVKVEHAYPAYYISTLPPTIRVKRLTLDRIDTVDFQLYVRRVLPHEWIAEWPIESLKAGAMAVKSYAWYWIDQGGRHADADVCDGPHCQRYAEETHPKTDGAVEAIWHMSIRKDGKVLESQYWDGLAVVDYTGGKGLSIRSSPEIRDDNIITVAPEGAMLAIVTNKPVSAYGFQWWDVVTESGKGQRGWAVGEFLRSRWPTYMGETLNEYSVTYNLAVRMSQYGSMYLANQGWNFREILSYYYPNIEFSEDPIDWDKTAKDYTATLRVTDNNAPPLQDKDTCVIHITPPPWKPVADPDGPYEGYEKASVHLDGSKSYDPESKMYPPDHPWYETIAKYEWDLDNDGQFDDSTDIKPSFTWETKGTYSVGLKVTDSQPSGPGGTIGPLDVDIKYTTVVIKPSKVVKVAAIFTKFTPNDPAPTHFNYDNIKNDLISYYAEISYGYVQITLDMYGLESEDWKYSVPHNHNHYGAGRGNNAWDSLRGLNKEKDFAWDAIVAADSDVDFDNYDVVALVHTGYGEEQIGGVQSDMWSQFFAEKKLTPTTNDNDGDVAKNWVVVAEESPMGLWAHEIGHALGQVLVSKTTPDLYKMGNVNLWDLMALGNWLNDAQGNNHPDHMSSYTKEFLDWLEYSKITYGLYGIESLETMQHKDKIKIYDLGGIPGSFYLLEARTNSPTYSTWDTTAPSTAFLLYKVEHKIWGGDSVNIVREMDTTGDSYSDINNHVLFSLLGQISETDSFSMIAGVSEIKPYSLQGAVLDTKANVLRDTLNFYSLAPPFGAANPIPDIDLHAYTDDGKHVGMNYIRGEYEIQIPGATASGDLRNGQEWIFVPDDIKVHFVTSSRDNAEFLNAFPEAMAFTDGVDTYDFSIVYYDSNGIRYESSPLSQQIPAGNALAHPYTIVQNPDGTYSITVGKGQPLTAVTTWITDSDFNNITSFRAVFTPDGKTGYYKLTATNPGQFYQNILVNNTGPIPLNITITYDIDPNFTMKGAMPIHVYADLYRTIDITSNCTFQDNKIIAYNVPPGGTVYVTVHLDYALKGTLWTKSQVEAWYSEHTFNATAETDITSIKSSVTITDPPPTMSPHLIFLITILPSTIMGAGLLILLKYAPLTNRRRKEN